MALKDVQPVLSKDFVVAGLDTDRMVGANDIFKRYSPKAQAIPWFAFLDGDGKVIVTSGDFGYPGEEPSATYFKEMLLKVAKRMTPAEIDALVKSVIAFNDAKLPPR